MIEKLRLAGVFCFSGVFARSLPVAEGGECTMRRWRPSNPAKISGTVVFLPFKPVKMPPISVQEGRKPH
ncbi:hypothetical protein [Agrobacterium sp. OT33]|uniref:hypothetical protein n=1 Tax=Agrobacterium sp. OT33 TaxID=2815338 RepID=UPI001FEF0A8D|nr:hypothetical protein [Agrobacterium sp. OT33]